MPTPPHDPHGPLGHMFNPPRPSSPSGIHAWPAQLLQGDQLHLTGKFRSLLTEALELPCSANPSPGGWVQVQCNILSLERMQKQQKMNPESVAIV